MQRPYVIVETVDYREEYRRTIDGTVIISWPETGEYKMYVIGGHRAAKKRDQIEWERDVSRRCCERENSRISTPLGLSERRRAASSPVFYPTGIPESGQSEQRPAVIATDAKDGRIKPAGGTWTSAGETHE